MTSWGASNSPGEEILENATLRVVGSSSLGSALPHSDIDVIVYGAEPPGWEMFLLSLEEHFEVEHAVRVREAKVPVLRMRIEGFDVDLQIQERTDVPGAVAHCEALRGAVDFDLLSAVRVWARRRGIDRKAWGFIGGMGWATLVHRAVAAGASDLDAVFAHFCNAFSVDRARAVSRPQILGDAPEDLAKPNDYLVLATVCPPWGNLTPSVTRSTLAVLREELRRARDMPSSRWDAVEPGEWERYAAIDLTDKEADARGWIEGHLISLLIDLERAGFALRPYADGNSIRIGLNGTASHVDAFARFRERFREAYASVRLRLRME